MGSYIDNRGRVINTEEEQEKLYSKGGKEIII